MRQTVAALAVSLLAALLTSPVDAAEPSGADVEAAQDFRAQFGLRTDDGFVRSTFEDSTRFSSDGWGVPLSAAEVRDLVDRLEVQRTLPPAISYAVEQPGYAGTYIDQRDKGLPVFLFTKQIDDRRAEIGRLLPAGTRCDVRKVDYTLDELTRLQKKMTGSGNALRKDGVVLVSSSVNVEKNRVQVGIVDRTERRSSTVKAIDDRVATFDEDLPVYDSCAIDDCPALKGGLKISSTGSICTSGYLARRYDTTPDQLVMVTAGHCIAFGSGTNWYHSNAEIGTENPNHGWTSNSLADVGIIRLKEEQWPSSRDKFLSKPSDGTVAAINGTLNFAQQIEGLQVCRIGWGSTDPENELPDHYTARKCGTITLESTDLNGTDDPDSKSCVDSGGDQTCKVIRDMKKVNFDSWKGDSGGIIFENNYPDYDAAAKLLGSLVHSHDGKYPNATHSWYSTVGSAIDRLDNELNLISPCTTASCGLP